MKKISLTTSQTMRIWDQQSIELGIPELVLIENAARASLEVLRQKYVSFAHKNILVFMGAGNNGADALCLARYLSELGADVSIIHSRPLPKLKKSSKKAKQNSASAILVNLAQNLALNFISAPKFLKNPLNSPDIIIDGLLGTGYNGVLGQLEADLIAYINKFSKCVLALDIPSGLNALTGAISENAVRAEATVSFETAKVGMIFEPARAYTGKIYVRSIGIPSLIKENNPSQFELLAPVLDKVKSVKHKGEAGHVLILGSTKGLVGAAKLAALSAMRSGAGLVTIALPRALSANLTDIMEYQLQGAPDYVDAHSLDELAEHLHDFSSVVLGVGLGKNSQSLDFIERYLEQTDHPATVFDADALNLLALKPKLLAKLSARDVITPHPKEASRLLQTNTQEIMQDRLVSLAKLCALTPAVCLLKGVNSLVAQGLSPVCISPAHVPNLAVAGSGDVLSGLIAALFAQYLGQNNYSSLELTKQGLLQHILAGLYLQKTFPKRGNLASELANALPFCLDLDYLSAFDIDIL